MKSSSLHSQKSELTVQLLAQQLALRHQQRISPAGVKQCRSTDINKVHHNT